MPSRPQQVQAADKASLPLPLQALNRIGRVMHSRRPATAQLTVDRLLDKAQDKTGLNDFGPPSYLEGLEVLVDSLNAEGKLSQLGRLSMRAQVGGLLENRLRVYDWLQQHPEVRDEQVTAPLMVCGMPRTGTTLLSNLLDLDPFNRSLLGWEGTNVAPPPTLSNRREDPRIAESVKGSSRMDKLVPNLKIMHPMAATLPTECVTLLGGDFRSVHFETQGLFTSYGTWFETCDMTSAYEYHRLCLQVLQSTVPVQRWALKTPGHLWHLDAFYAAYPDARVVWLHRDPLSVVGSVASLNTTLHALNSEEVDAEQVAKAWRDKCLHAVTMGHEVRQRRGDSDDSDTVFDLQYADLLADPVGSVERLYEHFGLELCDLARRRMHTWMRENPQDRYGRHSYNLAQFNLSADELAQQFADYIARYDVPSEDGQ